MRRQVDSSPGRHGLPTPPHDSYPADDPSAPHAQWDVRGPSQAGPGEGPPTQATDVFRDGGDAPWPGRPGGEAPYSGQEAQYAARRDPAPQMYVLQDQAVQPHAPGAPAQPGMGGAQGALTGPQGTPAGARGYDPQRPHGSASDPYGTFGGPAQSGPQSTAGTGPQSMTGGMTPGATYGGAHPGGVRESGAYPYAGQGPQGGEPPAEYLSSPATARDEGGRGPHRRRTLIIAAAIALVAALASGGAVYALIGRDTPDDPGTGQTAGGGAAQTDGDQSSDGDEAGGADEGAKGDTGAKGDAGDTGGGQTGAGDAGGGSTGGGSDRPAGSGEKADQGKDATSGGGSGSAKKDDSATQDDIGPQPDGAGGLIAPQFPDPAKATGGPSYFNETGGGV